MRWVGEFHCGVINVSMGILRVICDHMLVTPQPSVSMMNSFPDRPRKEDKTNFLKLTQIWWLNIYTKPPWISVSAVYVSALRLSPICGLFQANFAADACRNSFAEKVNIYSMLCVTSKFSQALRSCTPVSVVVAFCYPDSMWVLDKTWILLVWSGFVQFAKLKSMTPRKRYLYRQGSQVTINVCPQPEAAQLVF